MLSWFEKNALIRTKFRTMLIAQIVLACIGSSILVIEVVSVAALIACIACFGATVLVIHLATSRICTPYVNTVLRMEGLAAGDVDSPIAYTDYTDCVGRMRAHLYDRMVMVLDLKTVSAGEELAEAA